MTTTEAATLRRNAQALAARQRQDLSVTTNGRYSSTRFADADVDLWFALSAFADNASLYEQVIRGSSTSAGSTMAGRALLNAARRVDSAISQARTSSAVRDGWVTIRSQLSNLDRTY